MDFPLNHLFGKGESRPTADEILAAEQAVPAERRKVIEFINDLAELEGSLDDAIKTLQRWQAEYGPDALLREQEIGDDRRYELCLCKMVDESDYRMQRWVTEARARHIRGMRHERHQYETLRAKFEPKTT